MIDKGIMEPLIKKQNENNMDNKYTGKKRKK